MQRVHLPRLRLTCLAWRIRAYGSLGKFGLFKGGFIHGRVAELGHVLLYRSYQSQLHGFWRGGLIWLADTINSYVRPKFRFARD